MSQLNDLPPAARLACLIEAGVAANPDLEHGTFFLLNQHMRTACVLGFAALGSGMSRDDLLNATTGSVAERLGLSYYATWGQGTLAERVVSANDSQIPLPEILASLREGELAKVAA